MLQRRQVLAHPDLLHALESRLLRDLPTVQILHVASSSLQMTLEVDVHGVFDLMGLAFAICEYERRRVVFWDGEG